MPKQSEKGTEKYLKEQVHKAGGICRKYVSPGIRGVPDEICLMPNGKVIWVELKSEGDQPEQHQLREHWRMQALGHIVYIIDTKERVDGLLAPYFTYPKF